MHNRLNKTFFTYWIIFFAVFAWYTPALAQESSNEKIGRFKADITILKNGKIDIKEQIWYDFGNTPDRHGIYRHIPTVYEARGGKFKLIFDLLDITDGEGKAYNFTHTKDGGDQALKIGDANVVVSGDHEYIIHYTIDKAINFFDDHDELYWNVTGDGWDVPISFAEATVTLEGSSDVSFQTKCFIGERASTEECVSESKNRLATFLSGRQLPPGEGMTIVVGFPKGIVTEPSNTDKILARVKDNAITGLPLVVLVIMYFIWRKWGKDPATGTIVPQYDPPGNLSPMDLGVLKSERVTLKMLGPQLIYLATQGFIKITRTTKEGMIKDNEDFTLERLSPRNVPTPVDKALLDTFFGATKVRTLSDTKADRSLGIKLLGALKNFTKRTDALGFYKKGSRGLEAAFVVIGILVAGPAAFFGFSLSGVFTGLALVLSGIIIIVFATQLSVRTPEGVKQYAHLLGFKKYIETAEKDRIAFHDAPEKSPQRFQALLPFAMLLGLEKAWTKIFEGVNLKPDWYSDSTGTAFSMAAFGNSINSFSSASSASISTASSGGSGFSGGGSGGGGGGGGGGSW